MIPEPLKFFEIFNLLGERMANEPSPLISKAKYNQELFIAIFWEESFFRNMLQNSGWDAGRSVGFGQVQTVFINGLLKKNFKSVQEAAASVVQDNNLSADLAIKAMLEFDRMASGNKLNALITYAGGQKGKSIVDNWLKTSAALLAIPEIANSSTISKTDADNNKDAIQNALFLTRNDTIISKIF